MFLWGPGNHQLKLFFKRYFPLQMEAMEILSDLYRDAHCLWWIIVVKEIGERIEN